MPVLHRRRPSLPRALAAALLVLPACKPKEPVAPDEAAAEAAGQAAVAAAPVSAVARPAQMLPPGTGVLVVGKSPTRVAEALGRDRLVEAFGAEYGAVRAAMQPVFGFDPFDPSAYAGVGLDPEGPVGFAVLDLSQQVVAVFATLTDAGKFKGSLRDVAGKRGVELGERDYGGAVVLRPQNDPMAPAVVLRGSSALLVIPMGAEPTVDWAERVATITPEDSLSRARGYRRAMGSFSDGDLLAFIDPSLMSEQAIARAAVPTGDDDGTAREIEAARERGAAPEEIERLEKAAEDRRSQGDAWAQREAATRQLLSLTFSGVEGLGLRLTEKKSGVFVEGRAALGTDAFLRRALKTVPGRAKLPEAMSGEPLLFLGGGVDPAAAAEWLDLAMQADGTSWAAQSAALKEAAGIDLDRDLLPLLSGEAGLMVTLDEPLDVGKPSLPQTVGLAIHAQVGDPAAAKALLQKIDASTGKLGTMLTADGDRWVADVPGWRKVWVEIAGDQLLVATDKQLGIRMARSSRGMMGRSTNPPEAWAAMMMPDRAAVFAQDARFLALTMLGVPDIGVETIDAPDLADVPMSRKAKAKQKEIDALGEKLAKAREEMMGKELARVDGIALPLGTTVITAAIDDRGIDILGAQLIRGESLGAVIDGFVRAIVASKGSAGGNEDVFRLMEQRMKLEEELRAIREADAARIKGRKPRGGSKPEAAPADTGGKKGKPKAEPKAK